MLPRYCFSQTGKYEKTKMQTVLGVCVCAVWAAAKYAVAYSDILSVPPEFVLCLFGTEFTSYACIESKGCHSIDFNYFMR